MANKIILKKSSVASKVPLDTDLDYGELALNYTDGLIYYKNSSDTVLPLNPTYVEVDTLQDVTTRGQTSGFSTTTNKIIIENTTQSNESYTDAALLIRGGIGIEKDLHIKGDLHILGEGTLRFGPYNVGATQGNLWWVRKGGLDLDPATVNGAGEQEWTAFATIKHALKFADFGDTVLVQPGEYEEEFPLYVPEGVSIRGAGLRETQIYPTVATQDKDAFLLSGDSTISDFTVKNFFYNSTNDTGYAFRFATYNATLTSGVATVTVSDTTGLIVGYPITKISGTGAFGTGATILSVDSATQFTVSVNHATSGSIVFSVVDTDFRSSYVERCTILTKGSVTSLADPYGFAQGDAGRGALIDGALVSRESLQAALLFNEVTFIVPNSRGVIMTNGARSEMLTCFVYFADLAVEGVVGTNGRGMDGKTYITIAGKTGTWANGNTLSYYDVDGTTVIASATIESISGDKITIDGSASNFVVNSNRTAKTVSVFGNAQLDTAISKIGTASLLLDGTGDYLKIDATSDFQFAGDFCAESWIYPTDLTGAHYIFAFGTEAAGRYVLFLDGNTIKGNFFGSGTTTFGGTLSTSTWYHVALSRAGSTITVYLDGVALGTTETNSSTIGNTGELRIGSDASNANTFAGQLDELRITKGFRRYSGTFTPYTTARSGDSATVLLLHFDGADASTTIADDGVNVQDIRSSAGGTATAITRYDRSEFAAEMRSIACAYVYGNQGIKADGADVQLQLMAHNFAYIGTGADLTNDKTSVVQANEVIEVNGGKVFYNSVDQAGDYRVGDNFTVNFATGEVNFSGGTFDVNALGSINFVDGSNQTTVTASGIVTGNLELAGSTISTSTGNITIDPAGSGTIALNGATTVTGAFSASGATTLTAGTASTNTTSGTLVVTGGVGVSGTVFAGGFNGNLTGTATLASDLEGGLAAQVPYQSAANTTVFSSAATTPGTFLRWNGTAVDWSSTTFTVAGSTNQIQYNSGGNAAASANFTYDPTTNALSLLGTDAEIIMNGITNEPAPPPAGQLILYAKSIGGRIMPKFVGPSAYDTALQASMAQNKVAIYNPAGNATTAPTAFGFTFTTNGTATARNVATTNVFTRARRLAYVSAGTAGSIGGLHNPAGGTQFTIGTGTVGVGGFYFIARFGFSDTGAAVATAIRFVGVSSTTATPSATASPATFVNSIGVGAATGDTNLSIYFGGTAAQTPIALGANFPAKTINTDWYELILFAPSNVNNSVSYRVLRINTGATAEGTLTAATPGTQLPSSTTLLGPRLFTTNNATAAAVGIDIGTIYMETDT